MCELNFLYGICLLVDDRREVVRWIRNILMVFLDDSIIFVEFKRLLYVILYVVRLFVLVNFYFGIFFE